MKNKIIVLASVSLLLLMGCGNSKIITVPGNSFIEKVEWLRTQTADNVTYNVAIDSDVYIQDGEEIAIYTSGKNTTIHFHSADLKNIKTMRINGSWGQFFEINSNITVKLSNLILYGTGTNKRALIYVGEGATLVLEDGVKITGNTNDEYTEDEGGDGGGISIEGGTVIMNGGEISNNHTNLYGGGIYGNPGSSFIMNGGTIAMNDSEQGGGIWARDSTITINKGEISNNSSAFGGGIAAGGASKIIINGGMIHNNAAEPDKGGGRLAESGGGILIAEGGNLTMNSGEINGNSARNGGGIAIWDEGTFTMTGGKISNNVVTVAGGVLYGLGRGEYALGTADEAIKIYIKGGEIIKNKAKHGGGFYFFNAVFTKTGGTIAGSGSGENANVSTENEGDAVLYQKDNMLYERKTSLGISDNLTTDDLSEWSFLKYMQ